MSPQPLKGTYGGRFVFWGGAVDAQHTAAFGRLEQVREEALRNKAGFGYFQRMACS